LNSELFSQSESRAIKNCKNISDQLALVRDSLFPVAFTLHLVTTDSRTACDIISVVLQSPNCPGYIIRGFLGVLEILEVLGIPCPVKRKDMARRAVEVDCFAQGLRLYEEVFSESLNEEAILPLSQLNQRLGLPLAAAGVLQFASTEKAKAQLFADIGLWDEALCHYASPNVRDFDGMMRSLQALSRFEEMKRISLGFGYFMASATWHLFEHQDFLAVAKTLPDIEENKFFIVVALVMQDKFAEAEAALAEMIRRSSKRLFPAFGENYERIYSEFAQVAYTMELREVIKFKKQQRLVYSPLRNEQAQVARKITEIRRIWDLRFENLLEVADFLHGHLCIRSIVLPAREQRREFLRFLMATVNERKIGLGEKVQIGRAHV
jgi:hypothetical protein